MCEDKEWDEKKNNNNNNNNNSPFWGARFSSLSAWACLDGRGWWRGIRAWGRGVRYGESTHRPFGNDTKRDGIVMAGPIFRLERGCALHTITGDYNK